MGFGLAKDALLQIGQQFQFSGSGQQWRIAGRGRALLRTLAGVGLLPTLFDGVENLFEGDDNFLLSDLSDQPNARVGQAPGDREHIVAQVFQQLGQNGRRAVFEQNLQAHLGGFAQEALVLALLAGAQLLPPAPLLLRNAVKLERLTIDRLLLGEHGLKLLLEVSEFLSLQFSLQLVDLLLNL